MVTWRICNGTTSSMKLGEGCYRLFIKAPSSLSSQDVEMNTSAHDNVIKKHRTSTKQIASSFLTSLKSCISKFQLFADDDDGVPPCCHHKLCPLSNTDNYINGSPCVKRLGRCGFHYFDVNRSIFFGFASIFTFIAFFLTFWGCLSLSTKNTLVQRTYWVGGSATNTTSGQDFSMYVGLRSFEYVNCKFEPGYESYPESCDRQSIKWTDDSCKSGPLEPACQACASTATTMWTTAVFNCIGLVLAFLGAQTRMRPIADIPVQKLLGVYSEFWTFITLAYALFTFEINCYKKLREAVLVPDISGSFYAGPGVYCYGICCISALIRMAVHWMTPLPGQSGCGSCLNSSKRVDHSSESTSRQIELSQMNEEL